MSESRAVDARHTRARSRRTVPNRASAARSCPAPSHATNTAPRLWPAFSPSRSTGVESIAYLHCLLY